jgi:hypothetical protein
VRIRGGCGVFGGPTADDLAASITSAEFAGTKEKRGQAIFTISSAKYEKRHVEDETAPATAAGTIAPPVSVAGDARRDLQPRVTVPLLLLQLALGEGRDDGVDARRLRRRLLQAVP